jgi:hypothetical protein
MLASIQPFLAAELDYRRERAIADFSGSRQRRAVRPRRSRASNGAHLVPRLVRRAFAGH